MTKWTVIDIDKDKDGSPMGATYAMKVPGGMLIRSVLDTGSSMVFVPIESQMVGPNRNITDVWIEENKVT